MGCDLIRSQTTIICPQGYTPLDGSSTSDKSFPPEAGSERALCLECAAQSDGCKSCYDAGTRTETTSWTAICVNNPLSDGGYENSADGQGTTISTYQCYTCSASDPLPEHCSPPPPSPSPGPPGSPGSPGSPTPPPPPPPTPGCVNGGFSYGGF